MVAKFSKTFLIGVIGFLSFIIVVGIIYIVLDNADTKTRYSVKAFTPQGEVPQWVDFSITFSDAVIDNSRIGTEVPEQAIQFTPAVQGKARWMARDRIVFFLESPLVPSAQYTVELSPHLNPSDTFVLTEQQKFTFETEPFAVQQTEIEFQYDENRDNAKAVGTITFNYPVTIADLKAHLSIELHSEFETPPTREIPYLIRTRTATATTVELETARIRCHSKDQEIKIRIEKGFKCTGGQIGLKTASVTPIILRGRGTLGVTYATVREEGGKPYISLRFSAPVRSQTIEPYLQLEPMIAYQLTHRYGDVLIHGDFKRRTTYTVKVRRGVMAQNDSVLKQDYTARLTIPDVPPHLRFVGDGFFLARTGELNLGLATINVERVDLEIEKVFANNLIYVSKLENWGRWTRNLGKPIHAEVFDVASQLNEEVTTPISLAQYLTDEHVGVFKVVARDAESRWISAHQWVLITDLGVIAKRVGDTLSVWVKSLANGGHVSAARVKLISDNNQTLLSGTTNSVGFVKFTAVAEKTEGFTPFMLTVAKGDDLAFLQLNRHHIATADFNVAGPAYLDKGYEAFLYTSRGVYRPGETVQLAGIVRGANQGTPPPLPVRIELLAPDGRIMRELRHQTTKSGACDVQIPIPAYWQTGGYIAKMRIADKVVGRVQFQVEEFMPDRMKVAVTADKTAYALGEEIDIEVVATNLFGPPAAERKVSVSCELEAVSFPLWNRAGGKAGRNVYSGRSFHFSDAGSNFEKQHTALGDAKTDTEGKARYKFTIPATLKAPSLLNGVLTATVSEVGGRAVTATHRVVIHPYTHYVGLRLRKNGQAQGLPLRNLVVKRNEQLRFNYVTVDSDWAVTAGRALQLTLHKVHWNTILRQNAEGSYQYVSEPQTVQVEARALTSTADVGTFLFSPSAYGEYRVRLEDLASGARTEIAFHVGGWGAQPVSMEHPTRLDMVLDKAAYRPGETARLSIKAPFPGKLLLTVEREKILSYRTIALKGNTATLNIPVQSNYRPNVYISATLIREFSPGGTGTRPAPTTALPARAFGVVPLKLDAEPKRLSVEMFLSHIDEAGVTKEIRLNSAGDFGKLKEVRPNSEVEIAFRVKGPRTWQKYDICIAAVDEGILSLTDFQTPNPHDYFYRQRGLQTHSYDVYGGILPEIAHVTDNSSTGGDSDVRALRQRRLNTGSIMRVTPVSLWSGFVKTDSRGRGTVRFTIPQFNGSLRLMAVAFAGATYGAAEAYLTVREPIVLTPTFPRFLAGGDRVRIPVTVFNGTGADGTFTVELHAAGDVQLLTPSQFNERIGEGGPSDANVTETNYMAKQVHVKSLAENQVFFDMRVHDAIGEVALNLSAYGNDTETTHRPVHLPLRSAAPPVTRTGQGVVRADAPVDFIFPANLIADSSEFTLTLSPFPTIAFADSLRYLVRYPHGCLEQTTSQVFPLLYFSDLARSVEPVLAGDDAVNDYITAGITKLESMLMSNQHFAYWPGGTYVNLWSSLYASHFLVEARKAGYEVSDRVYDAMLEGLRKQAKLSRDQDAPTDNGKITASKPSSDTSLAAYACYVLAAAGHPEKGMMHYLKNRGLGSLSHYSHFQLAGAFALSGELETALSMLPVSVSPNNTGKRETGGMLDSPVRAQAIMLDVLAEVNENHPSIPTLVANLNAAASEGNRWATTQENAFAFLALGKILKNQSDKDYTGTLILNGEHFADFDATDKRYTDTAWDGTQVRLTVQGEGSCYYYWTAFGIQRDSFIEEYERELQVRRRYFNQDGEERTRTFSHGDLIVAEITVKALTANLENVVVVDMLPAGFEIENPRLESRAGIPWLPSLYRSGQGFKPDYIDIRDDRLIFFGTFPHQRERKFYYALRAVTQGEFTLPPIAAEAMYDATKSAVAGSMRINVLSAFLAE